jgi:hypothetical protein
MQIRPITADPTVYVVIKQSTRRQTHRLSFSSASATSTTFVAATAYISYLHIQTLKQLCWLVR